MIHLRDIRPEDEDRLREWRNRPEVAKYMYTDHHISGEEHGRWFKRTMADPTSRYWIIVCNDKDVGVVNIFNLDRRHQRCYWAFYIAEQELRGKGVGSFVEYSVLKYVFDQLQLRKLCCEVLAFNEPVIEMHRKFGFQLEGRLRAHVMKGGQPSDVYCLSILREEWQAEKSRIEEQLRQRGIIS